MQLSACVTDEDYEAWRAIRIEVEPGERTATVAELRAQDSPTRLLLLARTDGTVVGSGLADRSETAGGGFVLPRVPSQHRRGGVGTALLRTLADHCAGLGVPSLRSRVDDAGSLAFAERFGFAAPGGLPLLGGDLQRSVEGEVCENLGAEPVEAHGPQLRVLVQGHDLDPTRQRGGRRLVTHRSDLLDLPVHLGEHVFLAVHHGEVIGCAGLSRDADQPERAENALTAVRRDWRGHGIAAHLKRRTLQYAAAEGLRELYTWTQAGNTPMIRLNERLGYVARHTSITVERDLPLDA